MLVFHQLQVMAKMPGTRRVGIYFRYRAWPANTVEHAAVEQSLHQRDQLDFLPLLEQLLEHAVQCRMSGQIKMLLGELLLNRQTNVFLRLLEHR